VVTTCVVLCVGDLRLLSMRIPVASGYETVRDVLRLSEAMDWLIIAGAARFPLRIRSRDIVSEYNNHS
jgi:hypothetical protein